MSKMGFENKRIHTKYGNVTVDAVVNGVRVQFKSKLEYRWAQHLDMLKTAGEIKDFFYEFHTFRFNRDLPKEYTPDFLIRHNIPFRPNVRPKILDEFKDDVIGRYKRGENTKQIAVDYGVDRNTVSHFLNSAGIRRGQPLRVREFFINSDIDIGLFAGLLLGEGSIIIRGNSVRISIANNDINILGWLAKFGGRIHWSKPRRGSPNPSGVWNLSRAVDVFHCLNIIEPILFGKKKSMACAAIKVLRHNYGLEANS